MSMIDRAAQFSPFAALTGHNDAIIETARLTDRKIELDEGTKSILNEKIQMISDYLSEKPTVTFTHFELDIKKDGGAYLKTTGSVKKIDDFKKEIYLTDGTIISIEHIYEICTTHSSARVTRFSLFNHSSSQNTNVICRLV
mgnify:CR=1 FL=1